METSLTVNGRWTLGQDLGDDEGRLDVADRIESDDHVEGADGIRRSLLLHVVDRLGSDVDRGIDGEVRSVGHEGGEVNRPKRLPLNEEWTFREQVGGALLHGVGGCDDVEDRVDDVAGGA